MTSALLELVSLFGSAAISCEALKKFELLREFGGAVVAVGEGEAFGGDAESLMVGS